MKKAKLFGLGTVAMVALLTLGACGGGNGGGSTDSSGGAA